MREGDLSMDCHAIQQEGAAAFGCLRYLQLDVLKEEAFVVFIVAADCIVAGAAAHRRLKGSS